MRARATNGHECVTSLVLVCPSFTCVSFLDAYFSDELQLVWAFQGAFFDNPDDANFDIQIDKVSRDQKGERFPDKSLYKLQLQTQVFSHV